MTSIPSITSSSFAPAMFSHPSKLHLPQIHFHGISNRRFSGFESVRCSTSHDFHLISSDKLCVPRPNCNLAATTTPVYTSDLVANKVQRIVLEFESLLEPIDRVKRLLHYAANLAPSDESIRLPENRVRGCAIQVWLDVKIDEFERMRFRADSDSEIAKGYCSCLIWILDGAEPLEVLKVRRDDLDAMNVGLYGKAISRVNTWQNVLISMQMRTNALVSKPSKPPLEHFSSLFFIADGVTDKLII